MSPPWTISVATYNVLADAYIKPQYYPLVAPEDFLPENRHPRLDARVETLGTDVICAQEVDYAAFIRLEALLRPRGYRGRWAHRPGGKKDGCANFARAPWRMHTSMIVDFDDGPRKPSNRIAFVTVLANGPHLCAVANVHFEWGDPAKPDAEHHGLHQARRLLVQQQGQGRTVICGDFNAKPGSALLKTFEDFGFADAHGPETATFISDGQPVKMDYLMGSYDLKARAVPPTPLAAGSPLPSPTEPSDHIPLAAEFSPASG